MALGRPIGAKLFLEGIEVPFIGATITSAVGQASIAYVDVVPHKIINDVKPRTKVDIFVRDYQQNEAEYKVNDSPFPYVLAWQGEVFGFNFGKTPTSRTMTLSCIGLSSYWDCVQGYFFNTQQSTGAAAADISGLINSVMEARINGIKNVATGATNSSYFKQVVEKVTAEKNKDFLDAVIEIYKSFGYVNDFFRSADYRLRISDQIAFHSSKALKNLLAEKEAYEWFSGLASNMSGFTTLRLILDNLMGMIFHDSVSVLFPGEVAREGGFKKDDYASRDGLKSTTGTDKTVGSIIFKPNLFMLPPPMCNVFFPDEYSSFQYSRNFFREPTRLTYMPELPARLTGGTKPYYMPQVYEPPSFQHYMYGQGNFKSYEGTGDFSVPKGYSKHFADEDGAGTNSGERRKLNIGKLRQWNFLTNEEAIKGIWGARESMMPATSMFRSSLDISGYKSAFVQRVAKYLFFKKRFQGRTLQITSHLKISVVPGFPVLILDEGGAEQTVIAYCNSVTHRIYANEGGYTNTQLSYARTVTEQSVAGDSTANLLIPPWMDETIFGKVDIPDPENVVSVEDTSATPQQTDVIKTSNMTKAEQLRIELDAAAKADADRKRIEENQKKEKNKPYSKSPQGIYPKNLSKFYKALLGDKGSKSLSEYAVSKTIIAGTNALLAEYDNAKKAGTGDIQAFIAKNTARHYVRLRDFYTFLEASSLTKNVDLPGENWIEFTGGAFSRAGLPDEKSVATRRKVIVKYRDTLKDKRGFHG